MKKVYILLVALFTFNVTNAQSCLPQGITFSNQAQIDNFQTNYSNCTQIEGDVFIGNYYGCNITNLNGLSVLTSIGGYLHIQYTNVLTSLTGLDNLTSIGGYLHIESSWALLNLTGLDNLTSIGGSLYIQDCGVLTSLAGLGNLASIGGYLEIRFCNALTSLAGLGNIAAGSIINLAIYSNPLLSSCAVKSICDYLASPNGTIQISGNVTGCNSQQEVATACEVGLEKNNLFENQLNIYPNPISADFTISTTTTGHLSILNLRGQEFLQQEIFEPKTAIDVGNLPCGVYIIKVVGEKMVQVSKIMKQ